MLDKFLEFRLLAVLAAAPLLFSLDAYPAVPEFHLRDTNGILHNSSDWNSAKAILLFFVTDDCPVTNSYVPEMNRLQAAYAAHGVLTFAVSRHKRAGTDSGRVRQRLSLCISAAPRSATVSGPAHWGQSNTGGRPAGSGWQGALPRKDR